MLRKAHAPAAILVAVLAAGYLALVWRSQNVLTGDELFFYSIGLAFRKGQLLALDKSPPLFSLALSILPTSDVRALRAFNALVTAVDVGLLFLVARDTFDRRTALGAALVLGVSKFWVQYGVQLYAEPLFELLILAAFWSAVTTKGEIRFGKAAALGLLLGFAIADKPVGVVALAYIAGFLLLREVRESGRLSRGGAVRLATVVLVALVVASPALALGEAKFVHDYTASDSARTSALYALPSHLTLPGILLYLASLAVVVGSRGARSRLSPAQWAVLLFPPVWLAAMLAPPAYHFTRHDYPLLPFFWLTAASPLAHGLVPRSPVLRGGLGLLGLATLVANARVAMKLPYYAPNVFHLSPPPGCVEVKTWRKGTGDVVVPPVFNQPVDSVETYIGAFRAPEPAWYRYMFLSYLDDELVALEIDGDPVPFAGHGVFVPTVVRLAPGALHVERPAHDVLLKIRNGATMGGFGQVLFCTRVPAFHGEGGFPLREVL